jgi:hypothetical protein
VQEPTYVGQNHGRPIRSKTTPSDQGTELSHAYAHLAEGAPSIFETVLKRANPLIAEDLQVDIRADLLSAVEQL